MRLDQLQGRWRSRRPPDPTLETLLLQILSLSSWEILRLSLFALSRDRRQRLRWLGRAKAESKGRATAARLRARSLPFEFSAVDSRQLPSGTRTSRHARGVRSDVSASDSQR